MNTSSGKAINKIAEKIEGTYPLYEKEEHKFSLMFFKQLFGKGVTRWFSENYSDVNVQVKLLRNV